MAEEIERLNYYQLQFLGADDFKAEQLYHRDMRRRHNLGPHTWGIVTGLELDERPRDGGTDVDVYILPGLAVDGFGREIVVSAPYKLTASEFEFIQGTGKHSVWLAFAEEQATPPAYGYGSCDGGEQNDRVRELFRVVIDPSQPTHAPVQVDDLSLVPADGAVPYQELPDTAATRWLVLLGRVEWTGTAFSPLPTRHHDRQYAGVVAESILAPAGRLVLRPRTPAPVPSPPAPPPPEPAFAVVEGRLEVEGTVIAQHNVRVNGGDVFLDASAGTDDSLSIGRRISPNWTDLRVRIGDSANATHRLSIGPRINNADRIVLAVQSNDVVAIDTGKLEFGPTTPPRQMINLSPQGTSGFGIDSAGQYSRSTAGFSWYTGGDETGGGVRAMGLDSSGRLDADGGLRTKGVLDVSGNANVGGRVRLLVNANNNGRDVGLARATISPTADELQVIIGDGLKDDSFAVGPVAFSTSTFEPNFRVSNKGDVDAQGHASIKGNLTVLGTASLKGTVSLQGGLTVSGNTQLQSLAVGGNSQFAGDLQLTSGKAITYGAAGRYPVDVVPGVLQKSFTYDPSLPIPNLHYEEITVTTNLPHVSNHHLHVALASIRNVSVATDAQWSVRVDSVVVNGNQYKYKLEIIVGDSDGFIDAISWIAFFYP